MKMLSKKRKKNKSSKEEIKQNVKEISIKNSVIPPSFRNPYESNFLKDSERDSKRPLFKLK